MTTTRPTTMTRWTVALAAAVSGVACGPSVDDYPLLRPDAEQPDPALLEEQQQGPTNFIENEPLEPWDESDAGPLSGIFAVEVNMPANVIVDLDTRQLFRFRMLQQGSQLRFKSQMCRIALPNVEGVAQLEIPLELEKLIRSKSSEATGSYLSSAEPIGAVFSPPTFSVLLGASLTDPDGPLPTPDNLANASDEDGDGEPGVTLLATTLLCSEQQAAYAALRAGAAFEGKVATLDAFQGSVQPQLDVSVIGYSDPCMAAAADLPIQLLEGASFRTIRTRPEHDIDDNGNVTCGEVVEAAPQLFGAFWEAP
jgi:hypothetical protein